MARNNVYLLRSRYQLPAGDVDGCECVSDDLDRVLSNFDNLRRNSNQSFEVVCFWLLIVAGFVAVYVAVLSDDSVGGLLP